MQDNINQYLGIVVSSKANYFNVDIDLSQLSSDLLDKEIKFSSNRILCTVRNRLKHIGSNVLVGDKVLVECIDWNLHKGVIYKVLDRKIALDRPPVANVTNILIV